MVQPSEQSWVPESCTLPSADQPLRSAEFEELFASGVTAVQRSPAGVRLMLTPDAGVAGRAADLAAREAQCCSLFTFILTATGGGLSLDITAPPNHGDVLDAIAVRARAAGR